MRGRIIMFEKLNSISRRHKLPRCMALPYELFVRAYQRPVLRGLLKLFFRSRKPSNVFFILGCYNSGTTVIKEVVALHPSITIAPVEGDLITGSLDRFESGLSPRCMYVNAEQIIRERKYKKLNTEEIISDWRPWIRSDKIFLEKSISNTVRVNRLRLAFQGTKFVCVTRSVEGVVRGIKKKSFPTGILRKILGEPTYPDELLIRQWVMFYSLVLSDYDAEEADIYFVSYEKFLSSPLAEVKKIYAFMGLSSRGMIFGNDHLTLGGESLHIRRAAENQSAKYICTSGGLLTAINEVKSKL